MCEVLPLAQVRERQHASCGHPSASGSGLLRPVLLIRPPLELQQPLGPLLRQLPASLRLHSSD
jgi:hypothetical protein